MNNKKTDLGPIYMAEHPDKPLKVFTDVFHAYNYTKKVSTTANKVLAVYQLETNPDRLVKICSFSKR
jgi:hypothetical protein